MGGSRRSDEVWRRYFAALAELAASGHVDVLAHPDLAKIFGDASGADRVPARSTASRSRSRPTGCTSRSASCTRTSTFLESARLPITLASDAHVPQNVGRDLDRAVELARAAGYETVTVFDGRRRARSRSGDRVGPGTVRRIGAESAQIVYGHARVSRLGSAVGRRVDIPQPLPGWGYGRRAPMLSEGELRIGLGVDAHALEEGVPLVLGGVRVDERARPRRPLRRRRDHPRADRRGPRRRRTWATSARCSPRTAARRPACRRSSCWRTPTRAFAPPAGSSSTPTASSSARSRGSRRSATRCARRSRPRSASTRDRDHRSRDDDRRARLHRARRRARRPGRRVDSSGLDEHAPASRPRAGRARGRAPRGE